MYCFRNWLISNIKEDHLASVTQSKDINSHSQENNEKTSTLDYHKKYPHNDHRTHLYSFPI